MAKNTHAQEVATGTSDSYSEEELADPFAQLRNRPVLGVVDAREDAPSQSKVEDGTDSSTSSKSESRIGHSDTPSRLAPALTTENPSDPVGKETVSSARSTDTDGHEETQKPSGSRRPAKRTASTRGTNSTAPASDDFDEFE